MVDTWAYTLPHIQLTSFLKTSAYLVYMGRTDDLVITHIFWMKGLWDIHAALLPVSVAHTPTHTRDTLHLKLSGHTGPSQLCDDDKMHSETSPHLPPPPSTISHTQTLIHGYTLFLQTLSLTLQHWFDSCGAACQRCHADRKLLTQRGV